MPSNRVRSPADQSFASGCSPPRLAATQLPLTTESWHTPTRTCTVLMERPRGRTRVRTAYYHCPRKTDKVPYRARPGKGTQCAPYLAGGEGGNPAVGRQRPESGIRDSGEEPGLRSASSAPSGLRWLIGVGMALKFIGQIARLPVLTHWPWCAVGAPPSARLIGPDTAGRINAVPTFSPCSNRVAL